jgi:hypothetical protein
VKKCKYSLFFAAFFGMAALCVSLAMGVPQQVYAAQVSQGNALVDINHREVPYVDNTSDYSLAKRAKPFASSKEYQKETKLKWKFYGNTYKSVAYDDKSTKWTFKSQFFLPVTVNKKEVGGWTEPQSMVVTPDGKYIFVLYGHKAGSKSKLSKGFIVRYDYTKMKKLGLTSSKNLYKIRKAAWDKAYHYPDIYKKSSTDKKIFSCMKVGPLFTVGHGQSLAYNPKTKQLWMWQDREKSGGGFSDKNGVARLQRVSKTTLKADLVINFKITSKGGSPIQMGHNLAFDKKGYGYFVTTGGAQVFSDPTDPSTGSAQTVLKVYKITFGSKNKVRINWIQNIQNGPREAGSPIQSLGYNPRTNKLIVVGDDSILTLPVSKLTGKIGDLKASDIHYANFNTKREFESITFDKSGYAYMLLNRGPEILKSTAAVKY